MNSKIPEKLKKKRKELKNETEEEKRDKIKELKEDIEKISENSILTEEQTKKSLIALVELRGHNPEDFGVKFDNVPKE